MWKLPSRQVHLDFHTSEFIPGVGSRFSKKNFQEALKLGNCNSITIFAKCHHSWCYYPTEVGRMHPELNFDLTGAMMEAAHEIGVRTPVYITVGWSSNDAEKHPDWLARNKDGSVQVVNFNLDAKPEDKKPIVSWKVLCPSGAYADHIYKLTEEICDRYEVIDGLFYDICFIDEKCYCENCIKGMKEYGYDINSEEAAKQYYILMRRKFMSECTSILRKRHKKATIFFNGGADQYRTQFHDLQSHFELEDLPTTWGGYDKMPPRAKFFARSGKDYLGMTGKFHTMWGEFGGFKNPDALKYECAVMLAYGAGCSTGDQMHPCGEMDLETYRTIGYAYRYVEEIEDYCFDAEETSKLGIVLSQDTRSDEGLVKMLLEKQLDFDIVMAEESLERFGTVIFPDCVQLSKDQADRFNDFLLKGGSIILTGTSALDRCGSKFSLDIGADYEGPSEYDCDYVIAGKSLCGGIVKSPFLFYEGAQRIILKDGEALAGIKEPYFNRTYGHYCSHQNTPYKLENARYPAAVRKGNVVYLAHPVCRIYYEYGAQYHRDYFINALKLIYKNPVMTVGMPSSGRARFVRQKDKQRYVLHLLYAAPIQRGRASVIEDMPTLYNVEVKLKIKQNIRNVFLVPEKDNIPFEQSIETVSFTVPNVKCHQVVVLEY